MTVIPRALLAVIVICFAGCKERSPDADAGHAKAAKVYQVMGIVRSAPDLEDGSVMIEHMDIPGFMPAMTMPFEFRDSAEMKGVAEGDAVAFDFIVTETDSWIARVKKVDAAEVKLPGRIVSKTAAPKTERLKEGQRLPEFQLVDQAGRSISSATFSGKPLVLTFIFTRCPVPNFCPLMTKNFQALQEAIRQDPQMAGKVNLLSISFDAYDTPEVLTKYGKLWTDDPDTWRFATGSTEEIQKLTQAFAVQVNPEAQTINHSLATALVRPDGTIDRIWRGNGWKTVEVLSALRALQPRSAAQLSHIATTPN